jgi:NAD(P)-dependent dehydrogenase (short-subunit alcohol dehydrogenase family)
MSASPDRPAGPLRLAGRNAFVTGAASGIGKSIAERFAAEGAAVVVADVDAASAKAVAAGIASSGGQAVAVSVDVSNAESVSEAIGTALRSLGQIDILANVAGIWIGGSVTETSVEDWDRVINVNLRGPFLCSRAVLPAMVARRDGVIVNVASITAFQVTRRSGAYNPSKAGLVALTKVMAVDYAPYAIRVNAICPGGVTGTRMEAETIRFRQGTPDEAYQQAGTAIHPLGRRGTPDEIAGAAAYLASDDARWVTGSCLVIDGGASARL